MNNIELTIEALKRCVPADVFNAAMEKVKAENGHPASGTAVVTEATQEFLTQIGIPSHVLGYRFLTIGLTLLVEEPSLSFNITTRLYPKIVDRFWGTTAQRVERGIRSAIESAWSNGDPDELARCFGEAVSYRKGRPTNAAFMVRAADLIRREVEKKGVA